MPVAALGRKKIKNKRKNLYGIRLSLWSKNVTSNLFKIKITLEHFILLTGYFRSIVRIPLRKTITINNYIYAEVDNENGIDKSYYHQLFLRKVPLYSKLVLRFQNKIPIFEKFKIDRRIKSQFL